MVRGADEDFIANEKISKTDEKWLIDIVSSRFDDAEDSKSLKQNEIDELYVLVGALKVLGFEDAARAFAARLGLIDRKKTN